LKRTPLPIEENIYISRNNNMKAIHDGADPQYSVSPYPPFLQIPYDPRSFQYHHHHYDSEDSHSTQGLRFEEV
jgi:hypothetical protein